jgi:hypothetical protein
VGVTVGGAVRWWWWWCSSSGSRKGGSCCLHGSLVTLFTAGAAQDGSSCNAVSVTQLGAAAAAQHAVSSKQAQSAMNASPQSRHIGSTGSIRQQLRQPWKRGLPPQAARGVPYVARSISLGPRLQQLDHHLQVPALAGHVQGGSSILLHHQPRRVLQTRAGRGWEWLC